MIKYAILGLLRDGPSHGYRLRCLFERRIGRQWELNLGQVYQTLAHIERAGWVRRHPANHAGRRPTKAYEITDKGRRAFARWQLTALRPPPPLRHDLFLRLAFVDEAARPTLESLVNDFQQWVREALEHAEGEKRGARLRTHTLSRLVFLEATVGQLRAMLAALTRCQELLLDSAENRPPPSRTGKTGTRARAGAGEP